MSEGERTETPLAAPKEDPETLVLRGRPRPVIRFRRGLIIGVTGTATAALIGLAWLALEPPSFKLAGDAGASELASKAAPDGLADAPASYADVPQLGPPLPGDLGRPILEQQRKLDGATAADGQAMVDQAEFDWQRQAEQRLADQAEAARTSAVLVRIAVPAAPDQRPTAISATQPDERLEASAGPAATAGQQRKIDFARAEGRDTNPHPLLGPPSPWTLSAGTVVPASLITGINSDLPGIVLAQVTEQVRDSATGRAVLIPQGSRLIGSYDSMVAFGQRRALIVWQRIVLPDGSSVQLDNVPAADLAGYAGLEDKVDFHEWRLLKGIGLSTLLGIGSELSLGSEDSDLVRAIERSVQRDGARAGDQLASRNLEVQPTLTIQPGWPVRAILHKDLILKPWRG
ncbi:MAG: TrbI/VirB10 family protein [Pseudomonadota bacterium]|nr:TrbI/VirB10 family protein [Pseudomonadota bacterium]